MHRILISCLALLQIVSATPLLAAASPGRRVISSYYVEGLDSQVMRRLNESFDVERRRGAGFEVLVPENQASQLLEIAPQAKLVEHDIHDIFVRMDKAHPGWRASYRDFESVQKELKELTQTHSEMATLESYGNDEQGRPLTVLRLTGKSQPGVDKPEIMITSSTHGDEVMTVEVLMDFIQGLVKSYGSDTRITKMLDKHVVYFIPVVCPDGYVNNSRECEGLDPNRNYPYPDDPTHESIAALKNEQAWFAKKHIAGSLDIHSNMATVMYPWAYTSSRPAEEDLVRFKQIGQVMANDTGYNFGQIYDVFGSAVGSSADYWYWKGKTLAFGYEIGGGFLPSPERVHEAVRGDQEALWHFIEYF